jgi:hypothetical protein
LEGSRSKAIVTRSALERVLARAAELQMASGDDSGPAETLTEAQVEELGKEVGLSTQHIRQALAEERARIEPVSFADSGIGYQLFGPGLVSAQRVVRGKPERILTTVDRWMQRDEALRVKRQRADFISWEPARGVVGSIRRMLGSGDFALARADEVNATVVGVDEEFSVIRLQATFEALRAAMGRGAAAGALFGAASTGVALVLGVMGVVAIAPAIVFTTGSYYSARRRQHHAVERAALALEQMLDKLERGDKETPSFLRMIESALPPSR